MKHSRIVRKIPTLFWKTCFLLFSQIQALLYLSLFLYTKHLAKSFFKVEKQKLSWFTVLARTHTVVCAYQVHDLFRIYARWLGNLPFDQPGLA